MSPAYRSNIKGRTPMSLHAIEIAAVVTVAIALSRFRGLLWCNPKPLAADVAGVKVPMQNPFHLFCVIA